MSTLRLEIRDAEGPQGFFYRVVDGTDIVARSETMYQKASAAHGAQILKDYANTTRITFEAFLAKNGEWDWHAQSRNGEIMIQSTNWYATEAAAWRAARFVETNVGTAQIVDMTIRR